MTKGVPLALYSDRHGIFVRTTSKQEPSLEEQLSGRRQLTQMGRLLGELQVELILSSGDGATRLAGSGPLRVVPETLPRVRSG